MFLKFKQDVNAVELDGALVEIQDVEMLTNPNEHEILGRIQSGEEEQDTTAYGKVNLTFLSGESLPRCWMDINYRKTQ